jgi:predicted metalloprotease with PDZ domain
MRGVIGWVALAALGAAGSAIAAPKSAPLMSVVVKGHAADTAAGHQDVDVTETIPQMNVAAGARLLTLALQTPGMAHAQAVNDVTIRDDEGVAPLTPGRDGEWASPRRVHGTVIASYRLPIENVAILSGAPPIMMRLDGDGFSGQGSGLIALPPTSRKPYRISVHWDLAAIGPQARAVSSFGDGDIHLPAGRLDRISDSFMMAGTLKRFPTTSTGAFNSVWLGQPTFDPEATMDWTLKLHAWMSRHFRDKAEPPYRVFLRYNPMNAGGGAALIHSFVFTYKPGVTGESVKPILGHEMTHTWTADEPVGAWYTEGDAVYYQTLLEWRAGMIPQSRYLKDLNETASRYFTNPLNDVPDGEIAGRFWAETFVRVLPYDRGAMYFAVLNGKLQRKTAGKRSIDDLIQIMIERRRAGLANSEATWVDLIDKEIGPDAVAVHKSMMAGGLMVPESGDFGPCFHRVVKKIRRFDLGFDNASVLGPEKTIKGLKAGSEAEKAGLRDGDHFTYGVSLDAVQGDVTQTLTLQVTRDGKTFPITYLPRGEAVDAYQWDLTLGAAKTAAACHA